MPTSAYSRGHTQAQRGFAQLPSASIPRSNFNRSCGHKTSFNAGYLVPVFLDEALPGDTFRMKATTLVRVTSPIIRPIMDNLFCDVFFFAVPYRLLWENWERMNGAQDDPGDSTDFLVPIFEDLVVTQQTLSDYLGVPQAGGATHPAVVSLAHRAYNLIWNEWFRSEDLQDSVVVDIDDGPDDIADYVLLRRGKRHDYFTSCLPFAQKGDPVTLPLGTSAPIASDQTLDTDVATVYSTVAAGYQRLYQGGTFVGVSSTTGTEANRLYADLSEATAATINELRQSIQIQELLEKDARGGTRYTEVLRTHFGVTSPDARLQRPEFLGMGSSRININPVQQTAAAAVSGTTVNNSLGLGSLAAYGTNLGSAGFMKSFTEHCLVLGLMNVRADLTYQQGLDRMFTRRTRYEFYWPSFARLGEQAVLQREIFVAGDSTDDLVFGYQERYAEYRYKPSRVSGVLNSDATGTLDLWHLALDFASAPTLNDVFIEDDPPMARALTVPSAPHFLADCYFDYRCARPMPVYGMPLSLGRF